VVDQHTFFLHFNLSDVGCFACTCLRVLQVPAVPGTRVVDVTGCGNAFCGGFMAGLHAGLSMLDAARWGCVAGSIMAEWQGVPPSNVLWGPLLQQAAAKQAQLQAAGFEASAFPQDWVAHESPSGSGCSSSDAAVKHAGGVVQVTGAAEAVPAASSSSGSAVRSLRVRQHSGGALLSCPSTAHVQQRQHSRWFSSSVRVAPSSSRLPRLLGLVRSTSVVASGVHSRVCVRL
jgi:hypothetical protein